MKGGIASRLTIIFSLLVLVATATVGFLVFLGARQSLIESSAARLGHVTENIEIRFMAQLEAIRKDVLFLAETPPVQGIVRAQAGRWINPGRPEEGRLDIETNHSDVEWKGQLAEIFSVFLENRPSFFRIRLIGLADGGRELLRIELRDGKAFRVPAPGLQQKGGQAYFTEAVNLPPDSVYLSDIDLRPEAGEQVPAGIPMLRAATPIYDAKDQPFGILIVDMDFRQVLRSFMALVDPDVKLYLANSEGDLLVYSDYARISDAGATRYLIQDNFPHIRAWFDAYTPASPLRLRSLVTDAPVLSYLERVPYYSENNPRFLVLGATSPHERILVGVTKVRNRSVLITVLFALWGIALALVFSRYLTRPLRQVTQAISCFGRDEESPELPVHRKDEIGVLARTFDTMARQIQAQIQELEDKARRQRIILETSAEGIIVTDAGGHIETFNRAAEQIFGYGADEVMGRRVNLLVFNEHDPREHGEGPALEGWRLGHGQEVTGRRSDGTTFPLSLALSSFELAGEKKYAGFLQDITRRKEYEQTLREAKLTAEAANKAKSAFLANMSHEIRTPLTGIIGFSSLLARQVSGKQRKYAQLIESSGERLKETLNSVLDLAKLEANKVEMELDMLALHDEVQAVVSLFQAQALQKGLTLSFEVAPGAGQAVARLDRGAFSSILHNLIGNAIKFTDQGEVVVRLDEDDEQVHVHVEDTGVGIDPSFMPYLFDVFRQESTGLSRTHEGSGLGLSITQRLVGLMEGEITVQSKKGKGSTFTVSFARAPNEADRRLALEEASEQPASRLPGQGKQKLLLVEDNDHTQYLIENLLAGEFDVTVRSDAREALLEASRADFDMVLLDINLGEGPNGTDVLRALRAMPAYRHVPIAAITAYALPGDRERFLEMGFTAYLSKPFNAEELLALTAWP